MGADRLSSGAAIASLRSSSHPSRAYVSNAQTSYRRPRAARADSAPRASADVRALIVGAGAVGCYLAARLRLGGHDVALIGRQPAVDALRSNGITLRIGNEEWPVSVSAAADPEDPMVRDPFELAILAV